MKATWDSETGKVILDGKHKAGKPRHWVLTLHISNGSAKETIVVKPRGKVCLTDLGPIVDVHTNAFEEEHGVATRAFWTATAR